ncbi:unnamed protein product [Pylaiella littoralis]
MEGLDSREKYRFRLFEKCGMAMTVDGSGDDRITLEGLDKPYTFAGDGDSSDDEGSSETGNDGCGGGDDQTVEGEGDHSGEGVEDGDSSDEDTRETARDQMDELSLVDDDDSMESDDEIHGMEIPDGFRIQASTPAALDSSLLQRGVLVRLGMGGLGG